jgi:hypothetical protein
VKLDMLMDLIDRAAQQRGWLLPETPEGVEEMEKRNCPLETGLRPCECDLPRCTRCGYTEHDARFEGDHHNCGGAIPPQGFCPECGAAAPHHDADCPEGHWQALEERRELTCEHCFCELTPGYRHDCDVLGRSWIV